MRWLYAGSAQVVAALLRGGAEWRVFDMDGFSPLDLARIYGRAAATEVRAYIARTLQRNARTLVDIDTRSYRDEKHTHHVLRKTQLALHVCL